MNKELTVAERNAIIALQPSTPAPVLRPQTYEQLERFAIMAAKSTMVPKDFLGKPENIMVAVQMGSEVGLSPLQALQNIAVINGRPSLWGDAVVGLCRASGICQDITETMAGEGDAMVATCVAHRVGSQPITATFSVADAKKAGLWGKQGPWQAYPKRMLQMRARGFAVRDAFPDVLRGLITAEEARDIPADPFRGTTIDATPEPVRAAEPTPPRRATVGEFLDALEADLVAAPDADAVDAIIARPDVQAATDKLVNGAKTRLDGMVKAALARTSISDGEYGQEGEAV